MGLLQLNVIHTCIVTMKIQPAFSPPCHVHTFIKNHLNFLNPGQNCYVVTPQERQWLHNSHQKQSALQLRKQYMTALAAPVKVI